MSSISMPKVLSQRGKSSLEIERENFEKNQNNSITKAISATEAPAKEKHVRIAILGSHKEQGAAMFWGIVNRLPLQGNPIVCWKFLHVLHKLLRDGHPHVIVDSHKYSSHIMDLGRLWGHLKDGYGKLILHYCKLIVQKLNFHQKNSAIPGNMNLKEDQIDQICGHDINSYFELSVDMLDYMDDILSLSKQVFGSLDMSRSNSMTSTGQCRLAPLIMCIQDSAALYDYTVQILFKLHSSLPPDTLSGHRDRFYAQFRGLKQFYYNSANLQYFKNLVRVPSLPENPPNFLVASELRDHVAPVVVVPDPMDAETPEVEHTELLVDTASGSDDQSGQFDMFDTDAFGQNGTPSPPVPDDRDRLIEQLMRQINELKQELANVKAEDQMIIESLQNRLKELEMELAEMKQIAEETTQENMTLKGALMESDKNQEAVNRLVEVEKLARANDEKFKKMKDIYGKLREEHVALLRTHAESNKKLDQEKKTREEAEQIRQQLNQELEMAQHERTRVEASLQESSVSSASALAAAEAIKEETELHRRDLEERLQQVEADKVVLEDTLQKCQADIANLHEGLERAAQEKESLEQLLRQQLLEAQRQLLVTAIEEGEVIIRDSLDQFDNPHHATITCNAEYLVNRAEPVLAALEHLKSHSKAYSNDPNTLSNLVKSVTEFSHHLGDTIIQGKATSHSAPIDAGEELAHNCKSSGEESLNLLELLKQGSYDQVPSQVDTVTELVKKVIAQAEELMPKIEDVRAEQIGDLVDQEMQETTNAIERAAARIEEMLAKSREAQTGVQLEVNERILDSCTQLMKTIKILIQKSKKLQEEIVSSGRGTSSSKDFYKRHHRWTEGLLSAAKAVGWGANVLVEAADKVVKGEGKFEELMVCSQEIAASTTQLVVASKVKADRKSTNLRELGEASKHVSEATGNVVASAKSGSQMIEELSLDFSNLTLHQAKRFEMEAQVHVLELEKELEMERRKLGELRKKHYQLAGESEGWDQEDIENIEEPGESEA